MTSEYFEHYVLPEIDWMLHWIEPLSHLRWKITGFYMWVLLLVSLFVCLNCDNLYEKRFKPTWGKAVLTSVLMIWAIISLGDISTFLYFNF